MRKDERCSNPAGVFGLLRRENLRAIVLKQEKDLLLGVYLDAYGSFLTDKQREAVSLYYAQDLTLAEIAAETHVTRQGVLDTLSRARRKLYKLEEQLQLVHGGKEVNDDGI